MQSYIRPVIQQSILSCYHTDGQDATTPTISNYLHKLMNRNLLHEMWSGCYVSDVA